MLYALFTLLAQATDAKPGGDAPSNPYQGLMQLVPFLFIGLIFYFLLIRPQMRREKEQKQMIATGLRKNVEVQTAGGIIGVVHSIKENADEVTLKIDDNAKIRVTKSSIVRILTQEPAKDA